MTNADEYRSFLRDKRAELVQRIADACSRAGRDASEITLLAVSKTVGVDEVALAYEAGYRCFGENRPQELKRKVAFVRETPGMDDVSYHMIGNLQKNKINQVLGNADLVHSVSPSTWQRRFRSEPSRVTCACAASWRPTFRARVRSRVSRLMRCFASSTK